MKKIFALCVTILFLLSFFCSCKTDNAIGDNSANNTESNLESPSFDENSLIDDELPNNCEEDDVGVYFANSYEELRELFSPGSVLYEERAKYGEAWEAYVDKIVEEYLNEMDKGEIGSATESNNETVSSVENELINIDELPNYCEEDDVGVYFANSYEELRELFSPGSVLYEERAMYGRIWESYVNKMSNSKSAKVPRINNVEMELQIKEGFPSITTYSKEYCDLPCKVYLALYKGNLVTIYVNDLSIVSGIDANSTCSDIIKSLKPDYANVHNYQNFPAVFESIEERVITMSGKSASAIQLDYVNDSRLHLTIFYDNMLIRIVAQNEYIDEEFWSSFDVK